MPVESSYEAYLRNLPPDWKIARISEIAKVVGGGTPSRDVAQFWRGDIPWVTPGEISAEAVARMSETRERISTAGLAGSGATLLPAGSLMITTRATLGARAINVVPMTTNQGFKSLVFENPSDAPFYYYVADKLKPELRRRASGTTFLEVSGAEVGQLEVPVPPIAERGLIAQVLDTLDTTIRDTLAIIDKLKQVKQGLLHDLLTRGIDSNGELRPLQSVAPHLYKDSSLGWIPTAWDAVRFAEAGGVLLGRQSAPRYQRGVNSRPYLRVVNIFEERLDLRDVKCMDFDHIDFKRYALMPGDVLLTEGDLASAYSVGRSAVYRDEIEGCCFQNTLLRFRPAQPEHANYFHFAFCHLRATGRFAAVTTATTVHHLSAGRLAREVFLPLAPADERIEIADRLQQVEGQIDAEYAGLKKSRAMKFGIAHDLLTGRVRVTPLLA